MFESLTLAQQREIEAKRGWKPDFNALTYCTAEAVPFRASRNARNILGYEVLVAERTSGAPDCIGRLQAKWGTYVYPKDVAATFAIHRGLMELFGWNVPTNRLTFAGIVGPWLHKATAHLDGSILQLSVLEEQAEEIPFEAKLFYADVTGFDLGQEGGYSKVTKGARWVPLRELIDEQGANKNFMYWQMVAMCTKPGFSTGDLAPKHYFQPGTYSFQVPWNQFPRR